MTLTNDQKQTALNLWAAGWSGPKIQEATGATRHEIDGLLQRSRALGDRRAAKRGKGPRIQNREEPEKYRDEPFWTASRYLEMDQSFRSAMYREIAAGTELAKTEVFKDPTPIKNPMRYSPDMVTSGMGSVAANVAELGGTTVWK